MREILKDRIKFVTLSVFFGAMLAAFAIYFFSQPPKSPLIVAVIDTGVESALLSEKPDIFFKNSSEIPANQKDDDGNGYVDDVSGWNFFDQSGDIQDFSGHGTRVVKEILRSAMEKSSSHKSGRFKILPIKITKNGAGVRPEDLAQAIQYAIRFNSRVINISAGLLAGSDELKATIHDAYAKNMIIVVAAGVGIANPFKPVSVDSLFPHSYPETIVVGAASPEGRPELNGNYGSRIELVVARQADSKFYGSSASAATVSGLIARLLLRHPYSQKYLTTEEIRKLLQSASSLPTGLKEKTTESEWRDYLPRFGKGVLNIDLF